MKKAFAQVATALAALSSMGALSAFDVGGYFENWAQYRGEKPDGSNRGVYPSCTPQGFSSVARSLDQFNYAFLLFNYNVNVNPNVITGDWKVYPSEWNDNDLIAQAGALKQQNSNLKIMLSLGGWNFCDPSSNYGQDTYLFFQQLLSDPNKMDQLIASLDTFLQMKSGSCDYIFDGIDIDYEYPGQNRPGVSPVGPGAATDYQGLITFVSKLRTALTDTYGPKYNKKYYISIAVPPFAPTGFVASTAPWTAANYPAGYTGPNGERGYDAGSVVATNPSTYFAWFSIVANHCDWINLMTYDMYGAFNSPQEVQYQAPLYNGSTPYNFATIPDNSQLRAYSVDYGVQMWLQGSILPGVSGAGVVPSKIRLGLPAYGRSYSNTAVFPADPILQPFTGPGALQPYTSQAGIADFYEIAPLAGTSAYLAQTSGGGVLTGLGGSQEAAQSYIVMNGSKMDPPNDVFVYDSAQNFADKVSYARRMQLGGVFLYALSMDNLSGGPNAYVFTKSLLQNGVLAPTNLYQGENQNSEDYPNRTPN